MQKGFSTVEMMIAMVIMITAVSAIIMTSFGDQNFLIGGQTNTEAVGKAKELLENAQANARKDFRSVNPTPTPPATSTDGYYKWWTDVGPSPSAPTDNFTKQVTSHVQWTDDSKITRNVQLSTLVTNFANAVGGDTCNSFLTGNWLSPTKTDLLFGTIVGDTSGLYPISDIDVYQNKMYVAVSSVGTAPTVGPNSTASTAADTSISGGVTWTSPNNGKSADGSNTTSSTSLTNVKVTDYLKLTGFNFAIPSWATITGIKVEIQKSRNNSGSGSIFDSKVQIVKNNVIGGTSLTNKADTSTSWSSSNTYATYTTDLWGETWSPADINSPNFGIAISATGSAGGTRTAQIDNARITITYTRQFYILNTTNPTNPTFVSSLGSNPISTGINAATTDGKYAYLATNSATGQFEIVDLSTTPPAVVFTMKLGTAGTSVGSSIFYKDGYVYLGLSHTSSGPSEFSVIDVHNPLAPTLSGSLPIGYIVNSIYVRNNYAYIVHPTDSSAGTQEQVTVINISNPTALSRASGYHAPDNQGDGKSIFSVGDNLFLGRVFTSTSNSEFYILNNATPASLSANNPNTPQPLGKKISSSVNGLFVRDYLAFLLKGTATTAGQLQLWNITTPANITAYGSTISLPNASGGVSTETIDCEGNYMYIGSVPASGSFLNKGSISVITAS